MPFDLPRLSPMLATLRPQPFSGEGWLFERKFDGERCLAYRRGEEVRLLSRRHQRLNETYPELVAALRQQQVDDFIVDGEVVAFEGTATSFARLQRRMHRTGPDAARRTGVAVHYYLFDLLYLHGHLTLKLPLRDRKALLREALDFRDPLRFSTHRNTVGEAYFQQACERGWEGVIAKRAESPYLQRRSRYWLKIKCQQEEAFVVGGYTDPQRTRTGFGALLLGRRHAGELVYAGKVGTGFSEEELRRISSQLVPLERKQSPFQRGNPPRRGVHWVAPKLVAHVGFSEGTKEGLLRHPRFLRLRGG